MKTRIFKKSLFLFTAFTLSLSLLLAGCSNNNDSKNAGSQASSPKASESAPSSESANAVPEKEVHLDWYYVGNKEEVDNQLISDEISKYTKEKINATVQMHVLDWGSFNQKVEMMIASGEKIDVLSTGSVLNFPQMIAKGSLVDITDLYDKYGKDIQKYMPESLIQGAKFDGKLYGVPFINILGSAYGPVVRKDLVEKTGFDMSTIHTWSDMTKLWEALKNVEPNFTIKTSDNVSGTVNFLAMGYQVLGDGPGFLKGNDNLEVVNPYEDPEVLENLKTTREWYKAGYINKDSAVPGFNHTAALGENKLHGIVGQAKVGIESEVSVGIGSKYEFTKAILRKPILDTYSSYFVSTSIPRTAEDPDRSMMFINLLMGDEYVQNLTNYGIEGRNYVKLPDGRIDFPSGADQANLTYNPNLTWEWQNSYIQLLNKSYPVDFVDQLKQYNDSSEPSIALGFHFNAEPVKNEIAACANVEKEYALGLFMGAIDPEKTIPGMMKKFKAAGIDKIIAEKQKQLDAWAAANGKK
ncbi:ABC transporter substrate-binding protein [Cohnella terricola]|uniref:ABC transporter substrate-binding protein n=1 Tax=Cohnella terricola TaxID=1289167 RepID=A0A559J7W8_9BACL|nr:ABC transporter substrate-binding protein [Cohnella terricola]TVX95936.1 ABC transporter substrate-binding protein [Cohnella terricola]